MRFTWAPSKTILQTVDTDDGVMQTITSGDAAIVAAVGGTAPSFGSLYMRDDRLQVNYSGPTGTQDAILLDGFAVSGMTLRHLPHNDYWSTGYVGYEEADGVYDPVTGLTWEATSHSGLSPWQWWAYDNDGVYVTGRGNTSLISGSGDIGPGGDGYIGGNSGYIIGASLLGRWLYRNQPNGDGIARYNLDTDVWQAIGPQDGHPEQFLCADTSTGKYVTVNTSDPGKVRWMRVRDHDADELWTNPVPNGLFPTTGVPLQLGPPEAEYNPTPPGYATTFLSTNNNGSGGVRCQDGWVYYTCGKAGSFDYGDICFAFCRMNILTGAVEIVFEVPYHDYLADGTLVTGPENWDDTWTDNRARSVRFILDPPAVTANVDLLMQGPMLTQTGERPIYTTGLLRAAAPSSAPTPQVATVTADWVQRYTGDGARLIDAAGVSQGVLDRDEVGDPVEDGYGNERSLVGFTVDLPADADITVAYLRVPWASWWYANGVGNLVLGWHTHDTPPAEWSPGGGTAQLASYEARQEPLELVLQWTNAPVAGGTFRGLSVGPGLNDGPLYAGSTTADPDQWTLEIHYMAGVR